MVTLTERAQLALTEVRDSTGATDIEQYAVLGDGRGVALVAADGCVDWWAAPHLDTPPVVSALLEPGDGGTVSLRPRTDDAHVQRRYLPDTNVLETTYTTASGRVGVIDALNIGNAGALPWTELARQVRGIEGSVEMTFECRPGDGLRRWQPWVDHRPRGPVQHAGPLTIAVRADDDVPLTVDDRAVTARFTVEEGQRVTLAVVAADEEPLFLVSPADVSARLQLTIDSWRHWADQVDFDGERREQVVRSGLALKMLLMARTGAIAAAATTSLPERVGGSKNWDYRYAWVRDATLTIEALASCGLQEEVHAAMTWLLKAVRDQGRLGVMYRLDGSRPDPASEVDLPGYRGSRPVRIGNDAVEQLQLGAYGDLFDAVARWIERGHVLDSRSAAALAELADDCADSWRRDDSGLWELDARRPYTVSKMGCWRALDVAARLAEDGHVGGHLGGHGPRWRHEAQRIRDWLEEHCWSESKQAWTWYAGTDDLDAGVLLASRFGFDGDRMSSTIDAISRELGAGALVYRYTGAAEEEETFLACAYWRVGTLARVGRLDEAESAMRELDDIGGPLGLLSEMARPTDRRLVSNYPQALSHLALIDAAVALHRARLPTDHDARPRHDEQEGA